MDPAPQTKQLQKGLGWSRRLPERKAGPRHGGQRLKDERNWVERGGENVSPEAEAAAAQAAMCAGTRSTDRQRVRVTGVYLGGNGR